MELVQMTRRMMMVRLLVLDELFLLHFSDSHQQRNAQGKQRLQWLPEMKNNNVILLYPSLPL